MLHAPGTRGRVGNPGPNGWQVGRLPRPAKVSDLLAQRDWLMRLPAELEVR